MSKLLRFIPAQMTVDITPAWWRGGPHTFADGAALMLALRHDDPETGLCKVDLTSIEVAVVDIILGMHSVKLVLAVTEEQTAAKVDEERAALVAKLDALAETNPAWARRIAEKAEPPMRLTKRPALHIEMPA